MAEKAQKPLLMEELTLMDVAMLGQVVQHGGYKVIHKLLDAVCKEATENIVKLDPEEESYERKLSVRTQAAHYINGAISRVMKSIDYHLEAQRVAEAQDEEVAQDAVAKTFGIHRVPQKQAKQPQSPSETKGAN